MGWTETDTRIGRMAFSTDDAYVGHSLGAYGDYSPEERQFLLGLVPQGGVVVDAGANIGTLTVPLARKAGRVVAIEALARTAEVLRANCARNGLANVEVRHAAVSDRTVTVTLAQADLDRPGNHGAYQLTEHPKGVPTELITVDSLGLDRVDLIKADVEGMEAAVVRGAAATIQRCRPTLYLEADRRDRTPELLALLFGLGYRAWWHLPPLWRAAEPGSRLAGVAAVNLVALASGEPPPAPDLYPAYPGDDYDMLMARLNGGEIPESVTLRMDGDESAKIAHLVVPYSRGRGLDIGCGKRKCWPRMIGVDRDPRTNADIIGPGETLDLFADGSMDYVFSAHLLEHIRDAGAALRGWWRLVRPGGHLILYLPHRHLYPNIGQFGANPDHKHDFLPEDIIGLMRGLGGWDLIENETRPRNNECSFFQVYRKRADAGQNVLPWQRHPGGKKRALVIRYGAYGDHIMTASVLPGLRAQGYHVTYQTTERGAETIRHDPHIDEVMIQDSDQVPNAELGPYWKQLAERYDRIINLSESVEGTVLQMPGRAGHKFPDLARRKLFGTVNYLELAHDIAGVPHDFAPRFWPTAAEDEAARQRAGNRRNVLIALAGSALHKQYPHLHIVVAWLLEQTDAMIWTSGGPKERELEAAVAEMLLRHRGIPEAGLAGLDIDAMLPLVGQHYGDRFRPTAGTWSMRETMAFARCCDVVVGPETGVLNAVCIEPVAKVVLLSHSSPENLTKHWTRTWALIPSVPCWPCLRMHYTWEFCPQDKATAAAACAASIRPEAVFRAVREALAEAGAEAA